MPDILESLSHPALEKAVEITYQIAGNYLGRFLGARFYHEPEATWFVTDPIGFNRVISSSFTPETPKSTIDETLKQIAVSSGDTMTWDIAPSILSATLEECLRVNGWSKVEEMLSMVLDLHALEADMPHPARLVIELADDEETFKQHIEAMVIGFEFPEATAHYMSHRHYGSMFLNDPAVRYYVGRVDGKPVATSLLMLSEGIAGIYNVATIPQMRRQGFGTAMTRHALLDALELGYHVAVLQASEMGAPVYRRLGFQEHFTFASYSINKGM